MTSRVHLPPCSDDRWTPEQTVVHPQNNSTAKQQFSFPKAPRFNCKTQLTDYTFYALPSTKTKISALIGQQKRTLFDQRLNDSPAPGRYDRSIDGDFQYMSRKKVKGCYMALGRSDIKINNFLGSEKEGPNALKYSNPQMLSTLEKHEYSFPREKKFMTLRKFDFDSVGPGSYKIDSSLDEHKQILSSQVKSLCPKIQEVKVENRKKRITIEPPLYCPMVTAKGELLKFNNNKGIKIGNSRRSDLAKSQLNPGPGRYKVFSQFSSKGKV